eukprot:Gb_04104 [translate_table: standard]
MDSQKVNEFNMEVEENQAAKLWKLPTLKHAEVYLDNPFNLVAKTKIKKCELTIPIKSFGVQLTNLSISSPNEIERMKSLLHRSPNHRIHPCRNVVESHPGDVNIYFDRAKSLSPNSSSSLVVPLDPGMAYNLVSPKKTHIIKSKDKEEKVPLGLIEKMMLPREGQDWCLKTKYVLDAYKEGRWPKPKPFSKYSEYQEWQVDYAPIHQVRAYEPPLPISTQQQNYQSCWQGCMSKNLDDYHRDILAIRDKIFEMTTPPRFAALMNTEKTSSQEEERHEMVPISIQDDATIRMVKTEEGDSSHQESTPFTRGELKNSSTVITGISSPIDIVLYVVRQFYGILKEWWESCDEERVNRVALGGLMTLREELFDEFVPNHASQQNQEKSLLLKMK